MPRALKVIVLIAVASFALSTWAIVRMVRVSDADAGHSMPTRPPPSLLFLPEFQLIDQDAREVTRADLLGKVTIVDFIFTHCPFACPVLMDKMSAAAESLKGTPVQFISISVDPARDTPEALKAYAALHEVDTSRWRFLTGTQAQIDAIVKDGLKLALVEDPNAPINLPDGTVMNNIIHPTWLMLVAPDGNIFSFYRSGDEDHMRQLVIDARELLREVK